MVLVWYGATSEVSWLFLLAALIVAAIPVAALYAWWNARGLRLHVELKDSEPQSGSPIEELPDQLLRTAPSPGPFFEGDRLRVDVGLDTVGAPRGPASISGEIGGLDHVCTTGLVPRKGWRHHLVFSGSSRGVLRAESWQITASDTMGFFRVSKKCADSELGLVYPRFVSLSGRREARELEASLAAPRAGSGTELFGIREYRSGDSLRRIHWRSTARLGALVVREFEPPGTRMLGICLEPRTLDVAVAGQICRLAASEAWDCIRDGGRVVVWAPELEPTPLTRDLWTVLEWLARYPNLPFGPSDRLPANGEEVVVITSRPVDVQASRAWVVGDAPFDLDIPVQRVGTEWPL